MKSFIILILGRRSMKFLVQKSQTDQNFSLVYRKEDYSFDIEPHDNSGFTSIMINDLQLEIDEEGKIIYVWGLCPIIKYKETNEIPKNHKQGSLIALLDKPPTPGISYKLNEKERWPIYVNKKERRVCIGDPKIENKQLIEFAPGCIATIDDQMLVAVWLHPKNLPNV
jgi:hypothetical protein